MIKKTKSLLFVIIGVDNYQTIWITGGSSGIGFAVAKRF